MGLAGNKFYFKNMDVLKYADIPPESIMNFVGLLKQKTNIMMYLIQKDISCNKDLTYISI